MASSANGGTFIDVLSWHAYRPEYYFAPDTLTMPMQRILPADWHRWLKIEGEFGDDNWIYLSDFMLESGKANGRITLSNWDPSRAPINNCFICIAGYRSGDLRLRLDKSGSTLVVGMNVWGTWEFRSYDRSMVILGDEVTIKGTTGRVWLEDSELHIARDCMLSEDIIFQTTDSHAIIDIPTQQVTNNSGRLITRIGTHVWLARGVSVLSGVSIGDGSIIGFGSVVTTDIEETCMAAGVPARVIRRDVTWARPLRAIDENARRFLEARAKRTPPPSSAPSSG